MPGPHCWCQGGTTRLSHPATVAMAWLARVREGLARCVPLQPGCEGHAG